MSLRPAIRSAVRRAQRRPSDPRRSIIGTASVGGLPVGAAGTGIYSGYTLAGGDEFTTLDIVGPGKPSGYLTNRSTFGGSGARSVASSVGYYTDPLHTGYLDSNRGVPVITDTVTIQGGTRLRLKARAATSGEKAHFAPVSYAGGKPVVAHSGLNTAKNLTFYVGSGGGDIIVEAKIRHTAKAGNPTGWHPTFWTFSSAPTVENEQDEWDIIEANSQLGWFNSNTWASGSASGTGSDGPMDFLDGNDHTYTLVMSRTLAKLYVDGALTYTRAIDTNAKGLPAYLILTSIVHNGVYQGESFSEAAWTADADGAAMEVDWIRVWRKTGLPHYKPLTSVADVNVPYSGTTSLTLPSANSLWGDATVTEYVQCIAGEANDPTNAVKFVQFPPGVTYNSSTRAITVDWSASTTPPGMLQFTVQAYKATGSTCQPLTFTVNRGPKISISAQTWTQNSATSLDLYPLCDVGNLLTKTITVSGLPAGMSLDASTGIVSGTPTSAGTGSFTVTVTNSAGQQATTSVSYTVNALVGGSTSFAAASGAIPTNWSTQWVTSNVTWTENAGGFLRGTRTTANGRSALVWSAASGSADTEVLVKFRASANPGNGAGAGSVVGGVTVRGSGAAGSENGYSATFTVDGSGTTVAAINKYVAGTYSGAIGGAASYAWAINTWYWMRFRVVGTSLKLRVWADGGAEPGTWNVDTTDSSITTAGNAGVLVFTQLTLDWDGFSYATSGGTAPTFA